MEIINYLGDTNRKKIANEPSSITYLLIKWTYTITCPRIVLKNEPLNKKSDIKRQDLTNKEVTQFKFEMTTVYLINSLYFI